jgi:hypothetical protein
MHVKALPHSPMIIVAVIGFPALRGVGEAARAFRPHLRMPAMSHRRNQKIVELEQKMVSIQSRPGNVESGSYS